MADSCSLTGDDIAECASKIVCQVENMEAWTCYTHRRKTDVSMNTEESKNTTNHPPRDQRGQDWGEQPLEVSLTGSPYAFVFGRLSISTSSLTTRKEETADEEIESRHVGKRIIPRSLDQNLKDFRPPVRKEVRKYGFRIDTNSEKKPCYYCDCAGFVLGVLDSLREIPTFSQQKFTRGIDHTQVLFGHYANTIGNHDERAFIRAFDIAYHFSAKANHLVEVFQDGSKGWTRISDPRDIQRGDVIAYGNIQNGHTGHVWIALTQPDEKNKYELAESSSTGCQLPNFKKTNLYKERNWWSTFGVRRNKCHCDREPHQGHFLTDYYCWGIARFCGNSEDSRIGCGHD